MEPVSARPNPRLVVLLRGSIQIVQRRGLEYAPEVAHWLGEQSVTGPEAAWLGPRLMAYAQGMTWGYIEGANDCAVMFARGEDNLDLRRN